jgi:beta-glucosidase
LDQQFGREAFNPQWEFGFGMSYSTFEYKSVITDKTEYGMSDVIKLTVEVANTSEVDGKEVVAVFVTDKVASITPSVKRLRGFEKVSVAANGSTTVEIEIPVSELAFVNVNNEWIVEAGDFELTVGSTTVNFTVK